MKKTFIFLIIIFFALSFINSQVNQLPQSVDDLAAEWVNNDYGIQFVLYKNFTYVFKYQGKVSKGQWGYQNAKLCFKDNVYGNITCYKVTSFNNKTITLLSSNGVALTYYRIGSNSNKSYSSEYNKKVINLNNGKILAQKNGYKFTEKHFNALLKFLEFIVGEKITESEKTLLLKSEINGFNRNPYDEISQIEKINTSMQALYRINDPIKIGYSRAELFKQLYFAFSKVNKDKQPAFSIIMNKYLKMIVYDKKTGLALTQKDVDGYINYLMFMEYLKGGNSNFSYELRKSIENELSNKFISMSLEQKKIISSGSILWALIESNWKKFTPSQRLQYIRQFRNKLYGNNSPNYQKYFQQGYELGKQKGEQIINNILKSKHSSSKGVSLLQKQREFQAKQNMMRMMYNTNLQTHATSLNIIENIGGTGNYWEVKY